MKESGKTAVGAKDAVNNKIAAGAQNTANKSAQNMVTAGPAIDPKKLTDRQLHELAQEYGGNARKWTKKFAALLPEISRRGLYKRFGFYSIYEYAAKICGMSQYCVDAVLRTDAKLEDKPVLKDLIADQGWSKVKVVASIATPETQQFWAEKIKEMSRSTLETFVKELKKGAPPTGPMSEQTAIFTDSADISLVRTGECTLAEVSQKSAITFCLNGEIETNLRIFKQRLEKKTKEPQDWNNVMKELLSIAAQHENCGKKKRVKAPKSVSAQTSAGTRASMSAALPATAAAALVAAEARAEQQLAGPSAVEPVMETPPAASTNEQQLAALREQIIKSLPTISTRYIPALVQKYLETKFGGKCGFPDCKHPADIRHHVKRFALNPSHDLDSIVPLCKNHERLAHHGLIQNEESSPESWKIRPEPDKNSPKYAIDLKVQEHRVPK